jgi:hypothetical protein
MIGRMLAANGAWSAGGLNFALNPFAHATKRYTLYKQQSEETIIEMQRIFQEIWDKAKPPGT